MFSKNEDNKHKSLRSKQELSAFNAKKKKNKRNLKANTVDSAHGLDEPGTPHLSAKVQEPRGGGFARSLRYC